MKVKQLIDILLKLNPDIDLMILDRPNGGGYPREINLGPTDYKIDKQDEDWSLDCKGRIGEKIKIIGFGCYD